MSNDLLAKATALLEAREKATQGEWRPEGYDDCQIRLGEHGMIYDEGGHSSKDAHFISLAANTSAEIITGYQELVRRMADTLEFYGSNWESDPPPPEGPEDYKDWINPAQKLCEDAGDRAREILTEARNAILHTPTAP